MTETNHTAWKIEEPMREELPSWFGHLPAIMGRQDFRFVPYF